ncbi:hypothetical protein PTKIN_Ptkin19aG0013300 [Pterospermum kingtungense]
MTRLSFVLLIFLFALVCQVPSIQCRNLFNAEKKQVISVPTDLPNKKPTPPPSPTSKHLIMANNERLFALHLAKIDRILQSVPSPGAGH